MKTKIASSSTTRWNFSSTAVCTIHKNYDALLECLTKIDETVKETSAIDAATLLKYMQSKSFLSYLQLFNSIWIHVSILFNQLQSRQTDISKVKAFIQQFNGQLQLIKESYEESDKNQSEIDEAIEVITNIDEEIYARLEFKGHLLAESLFDNSRFAEFNTLFPADTFKNVMESFPFLNGDSLRQELEILYSRQEFRELSSLSDILECIVTTNLMKFFPEACKLLIILLTIPMTTVDPERKFSTLKRIKSELRNRMGGDRLNSLTAVSCSKSFFDSTEIQNRIIDKFANMKTRRMELIKKM